MARDINEILKDLERLHARRERIERDFWRESDKLTDEHDKLMRELDEWTVENG